MARRPSLDELRARPLNFDPTDDSDGWSRDDYRQPLPPEPPGPPLPHGSWEIACRLVRDYAFADPALVRAEFDPDEPLEQRVMLLELPFLGVRFFCGARVGGVTDETRTVARREARVWGWDYRTLQGHVEAGQRFFEVWKWLDTGDVEFRTWSFSRPALANPILRLGFRFFGRRRQAEWGRRACERMARLTAAELER